MPNFIAINAGMVPYRGRKGSSHRLVVESNWCAALSCNECFAVPSARTCRQILGSIPPDWRRGNGRETPLHERAEDRVVILRNNCVRRPACQTEIDDRRRSGQMPDNLLNDLNGEIQKCYHKWMPFNQRRSGSKMIERYCITRLLVDFEKARRSGKHSEANTPFLIWRRTRFESFNSVLSRITSEPWIA